MTPALLAAYELNDALVDSAAAGNLGEMSNLLGQGADPLFCDSRALVLAAREGHAECVKLLIPISDPEATESLALALAARRGHVECVKLLIPVSNPKANDSSALLQAAYHGRSDCVELLIPVSNPEAKDSEALAMAAEAGRLECVRLLIPFSNPNAQSSDALCLACGDGHIDCAKLLIPVSTQGKINAALGWSVFYGQTECVKLLLPKATSLSIESRPLLLAIEKGHVDVLAAMIAHDPSISSVIPLAKCCADAEDRGNHQVAIFLRSIMDKEAITASLSPSQQTSNPTPAARL